MLFLPCVVGVAVAIDVVFVVVGSVVASELFFVLLFVV
jgi:hypothetical protein